MPDDELVEMGKREIGPLGLVDPRSWSRLRREDAQGLPLLRCGLQAQRRDVAQMAGGKCANVHPVGRNGMHRYNNQDHSMYTAMLTVENIMGASHDVWSVNVEEEYHEQMKSGRRRGPSGGVRAGCAGPAQA